MVIGLNGDSGLSDQVAQALLAGIESGQLKRGEKLPSEVLLAGEFGVSRSVVREATSRLEHEALLGSRQGKGVFVSLQPAMKPLKMDASIIESRKDILQIVAQRRSPRLKGRFALSMPRWLQAAMGVMLDITFHRAIAQATGNAYLLQTLDFLTQYLAAATHLTRANEARRLHLIRQVHDEHIATIEAIRQHDASSAHNAAASHMFSATRWLAATEFPSA
jgi:GntR family transcriptional regulator, transcriptional repressor for pyruvate dehydrogenase complex